MGDVHWRTRGFYDKFLVSYEKLVGELTMTKFDKRSLVDMVYEELREDIITLKYPFGSKINVNELQGKIGVSCTPIREALNRLQQEGLIIYKNKVGAQVLTIEKHDVEAIQELAMTLHCAAIRMSMKRGNHELMLKELRKQRDAFAKAKTNEASVAAVFQLVGVFYHYSGNERLDHTMISIQGLQLLLRHMYAKAGVRKVEDLADYDAMIAAIQNDDPDAVCAALQRKTGRATKVIIDSLHT